MAQRAWEIYSKGENFIDCLVDIFDGGLRWVEELLSSAVKWVREVVRTRSFVEVIEE